ncbi:MAG: MFS transporter [Verrucomicrobia bacterium]|jgi:nucleoside transporter|nr:MFS transporter [Verrucomicrobiota bacterium]
MPTGNAKLRFAELGALFFLQWMALAAWMVPLTLVLNAHGLSQIQPYAFATGAAAAFISPLFFGALADRQAGPTRVLRWLALATALTMALASWGIRQQWPPLLVLGLIQLHALCAVPSVSITSTIVLSSIDDPKRQFGPLRAMGTIGWMAGCWLVSALGADASTLAGFTGAGIWLGVAAYTFVLPPVLPPKSDVKLTWHERLGLDALTLLRHHDHRVIYITACLFTIPLAAFYPYTPPHLRDLGLERASAWMSLGQTTEIVAMFTLGALLTRFRIKWILFAALCVGVLRYVLCALNSKAGLLMGIALHGCTYSFFFTTVQIYVNERVDPAWRARAQALLSLVLAGVGHLVGYLGTGWWLRQNTGEDVTAWPTYWGGLALVIAIVTVYFLTAYRGRRAGPAVARVGVGE